MSSAFYRPSISLALFSHLFRSIENEKKERQKFKETFHFYFSLKDSRYSFFESAILQFFYMYIEGLLNLDTIIINI